MATNMEKRREGRPLKFESIETLQKSIDTYFEETPKEEWTITGLALALDTCRQTLLNYQEKEEFMDAIKKAKLKVESSYEIDLKKSGRPGTIFALKNFNWTDKQELDHTSDGERINFTIPGNIANKNGINTSTESSSE